jgi:hypothetical protein
MRIQIQTVITTSLVLATMLSLTGCDQSSHPPKPLTPYEQGFNEGVSNTEDRFKNSYLTLQMERDRAYRAEMEIEVAKLEACEAYLSICPSSVMATGIAAKRAGFTSGNTTIAGPILGLKIFVLTCLALSILAAGWLLLVFVLGPAIAIFNGLEVHYKKLEVQIRTHHDQAVSILRRNQKELYSETESIDKKLAAKESILSDFENIKRKEWAALDAAISTATKELPPLQSSLATQKRALDHLRSLIAKARTRLDSMILTQSLSQNLKDPETKAALIRIAAATSEDSTDR